MVCCREPGPCCVDRVALLACLLADSFPQPFLQYINRVIGCWVAASRQPAGGDSSSNSIIDQSSRPRFGRHPGVCRDEPPMYFLCVGKTGLFSFSSLDRGLAKKTSSTDSVIISQQQRPHRAGVLRLGKQMLFGRRPSSASRLFPLFPFPSLGHRANKRAGSDSGGVSGERDE